ncbi:hypothetical protein L1967_14810 [Zunongwangia sp. M21534]|uniref:RHS repeat-associated core domain-containing protein n=1 Tax=Zunongwangia pacifica TaxID=2911062 RepID=A0A9X1ZUR1_9FLAO|nr:hypothetical protein [Zunongwangia pacifica]
MNGTEHPYKFQGKEHQEELGLDWYDFHARNYDPALGRWFNMDNHAESYMSWTPYNFAYNSPLMVVDPDGQDGIFINEDGKEIGNDGIEDGKVYVVKTSEQSFKSGVAANGITKSEAKATEKFIKKNSGNTAAFQENSIAYDNSVEIEGSAETRQSMVDIVNQDNGRGGTSDANNREYGGVVNNDGTVRESTPGDVSTPVPNENGQVVTAEITHTIYANSKSTFHSHPSGQVVVGSGNNSGATGSSTTLGGGSTTTHSWRQAPSPQDANGSTRTNYVFGRRSKTVYIYSGGGVIATIPQKRFVTPKQ